MKLPLKERESLLDKLIVWILGTPGKEKERLAGLYKQDIPDSIMADLEAGLKKAVKQSKANKFGNR